MDVIQELRNAGLCRTINVELTEFDTNYQLKFWFFVGGTEYSHYRIYTNPEKANWANVATLVMNKFLNGDCNVRPKYVKQEKKYESTGSKGSPVKGEGHETESGTGETKHTAAEEKADEKG